jgi:hypothetical protein
MMQRLMVLVCLAALPAVAQTWEVGVAGGMGFLGQAGIDGLAGGAAGLANGPAAAAFLAQNLYRNLGGEMRYEYQQRELRLTRGSVTASLPARTHSLEYALVWHLRGRRSAVRPYLTAGGGYQLLQGTGREAAYRPLMDVAYLTHTQEWKPVISAGGGVKARVGGRMFLRMELRQQFTLMPTRLITPAPGVRLASWLHHLEPLAGIGWNF